MAASPHISIIFVNYRSAWSLSAALQSLFSLETETVPFEVIVWNNDPAESAVLSRLSRQFPFRLLESEANVGFGRGSNRAASEARGTVLGFLNPDTRWLKKSLTDIEEFLRAQPRETLLGLQLIDSEGRPEPWSKGRFPTLGSIIRHKLSQIPGFGVVRDEREPDWVSGGGIFLKKETFLGVGGFAEEYFLYFEDVDLCFRFKERGGQVVSDQRFLLEHSGGKSFRSRAIQKRVYYQSQGIYFRKHRPEWEFLILQLFHWLGKNV